MTISAYMCTDLCSHAFYYYYLIRFNNLLESVWNVNESYLYAAIVHNGINSTLVFYNYHSLCTKSSLGWH